MAVTFVAFSDPHVNSYVGLVPAGQFEHAGGIHKPNTGQRFIARNFQKFADEVERVAEKSKSSGIVTVLNGDACDMHPKTTALISYSHTTMMRMTYEAIKPIVNLSDQMYLTVGTKSHTGHFEHKIAEDIGAVPANETAGLWAHDNLKLEIAGCRIWAQHHGRMGGLFHTERNAANTLAAHTISETNGERLPHLVLASHQHRWADSGDNYQEYGVRAIFLAGWQLPTGYINQIKRNARGQIGGLIAVIEDGQMVSAHKFRVKVAPSRTIRVVL